MAGGRRAPAPGAALEVYHLPRDVFEMSESLPDAQGAKFLQACARRFFLGDEGPGLPRRAADTFAGVSGRIDAARSRALGKRRAAAEATCFRDENEEEAFRFHDETATEAKSFLRETESEIGHGNGQPPAASPLGCPNNVPADRDRDRERDIDREIPPYIPPCPYGPDDPIGKLRRRGTRP